MLRHLMKNKEPNEYAFSVIKVNDEYVKSGFKRKLMG